MVTKASTKPAAVSAKDEPRDSRQARLAKALRDNLKRRKEQARARNASGDQDASK